MKSKNERAEGSVPRCSEILITRQIISFIHFRISCNNVKVKFRPLITVCKWSWTRNIFQGIRSCLVSFHELFKKLSLNSITTTMLIRNHEIIFNLLHKKIEHFHCSDNVRDCRTSACLTITKKGSSNADFHFIFSLPINLQVNWRGFPYPCI